MITGNIKKYAPKARTRFIETMTRQASRYGITKGHVAPAEVRGDVMLISAPDGQTHSFPKALRDPREALAKWVTQLGFEQAMEQAAYSWFNRLCAIRFMELKGYLDHGRRVLSHPDHEGGFQILDDCLEIDLPGLDTTRVRELKLDGTQDEALYRELLLAQCHALHEAMPFLFEPLDDASELLLPYNLTKTDSLIRELVEAIPEEDWQDVEVIGWLYQFYIAEKKDQVIGKVVKSEDIPAATQLFTPNWIVQYLVQNSVGRQWLQTYPDSPLKGQMPYYIEPAEQEPEVQAQLDAITPTSIDPETVKVLDPACGSGHILVEAYNVLKAIYEERGYRSRDIPKLILENNLFGLDIDDRAAQLAGFALLMKAREDDRRIFSRGIRLNVMALQSTQHLDASTLWRDLNLTGDWHQGQSQSLFESEQKELSSNDNTYKAIVDLIERFQDAKTFGSLIEVPNSFEAPLKTLRDELNKLSDSGDIMQKIAAKQLMPIVEQAWVMSQKYDAVVANPPYLAKKAMVGKVKNYVESEYPEGKNDLYAAFAVRFDGLLKINAYCGLMTPYTWMFLSSYEDFRHLLIDKIKVRTLVQPEYHAISESAAVPICFFAAQKSQINSISSFFDLTEVWGLEEQSDEIKKILKKMEGKGRRIDLPLERFASIPSSPFVFTLSESIYKSYDSGRVLRSYAYPRQGIKTGENERFLRLWHEVDVTKIGFGKEGESSPDGKWFFCSKGGRYRKWYGNIEHLIDWEHGGERIKKFKDSDGRLRSRPQNVDWFFKPGGTWSTITSANLSMRYFPEGYAFESKGSVCFPSDSWPVFSLISFINSAVVIDILRKTSPTIDYSEGALSSLPVCDFDLSKSNEIGRECVEIAKKDWDRLERSQHFLASPLTLIKNTCNAREIYRRIRAQDKTLVDKLANLEKENNKLFDDAYEMDHLQSEDIPVNEITLTANPYYRYDEEEDRNLEDLEGRFQSDTVSEFVSYALGCMFGRYSLDREGLVYAHAGNIGFDDLIADGVYTVFPVDCNGIIPLTDREWFLDDATNRFRDFIRTVWGDENLQENLDFVAESLCLHAIKPKKGEAALDTIRRYLSTQFYKDHLRTYKKRPIYWLFSSGKQKAFECLVYLHRYNESTLAEMRTDYVIPLTTKLASYAEKLEQDKDASTSAAEAKRIEKELSKLYKQQAELNAFDEKLRHHADQRISLDLDDGVKANYGKFGDLLAEMKAVTGEKPA
ncbi:BREX-1 system adenine-specific DNA-methyltransferase PglX [Halomonas sp. M4R5S39]|uniref:BREX-1 system adenine-specific DNA-methyltransferase PglX n=1 Tax=Halomonas kalidii TaxID=3043293 RepID=UPI0024A9CC29|nr:BREX-1 system adenine-specific DNA-methyltransferase PglX [Halomonas kalidii]MDI5986011.1 BREX-1 system adenine-specific DNA-methyltransferase PglX [Halomonas kalidii]